MSISTIGAIVFGIGYGINAFVGNAILGIVVAIAAIVWGVAVLIGK